MRILRRAKATSRSSCSTRRRRRRSRTSSGWPRARRSGPTRAPGGKATGPYYNGTVFHRVIDGFMIQGGDPLGQGTGGPGLQVRRRVQPEAAARQGRASCRWPTRGPNTNGGQFFITLVADAVARRQAQRVRRSHRRHGRRQEDRQDGDQQARRSAGQADHDRVGDDREEMKLKSEVELDARPAATVRLLRRRGGAAAPPLRGDSFPCASDSGVLAFAVAARGRRRPARSAP